MGMVRVPVVATLATALPERVPMERAVNTSLST